MKPVHVEDFHLKLRGLVRNVYSGTVLLPLILVSALAVLVFFLPSRYQKKMGASIASGANPNLTLSAFPVIVPQQAYGFALDTFHVTRDTIRSGSYLGKILNEHKMDYLAIETLAENSKPVFDVRNIRLGRPYVVLNKDTSTCADYLIYEPSVFEYVIFQLKDSLKVERIERKITTESSTTYGQVESSLWASMSAQGNDPALIDKMEDALQWSIDFYRIQPGDQYKLVYDRQFVEGEEVGPGRVKVAYYRTLDKEFYAIYYDKNELSGYYDQEGRPMNKGFLKSPIKAGRISSRYNLRRFHPILKRTRPHYGTDYAAPTGTPIYAVGSGVITHAAYTKGNGNYVKIRHDKTYQTQYLHMSRFAQGIRPGVHVKQGEVIGYVGSTGLATGPHVCFRFWKNGKQVNHLMLDFPPPAPLPDYLLPEFAVHRDSLLEQLNAIEVVIESQET